MEQRVSAQQQADVVELLQRCAHALDDDELEAWPELFVPAGQYRVLSRENLALGLPAPLVYYCSQGMLRDRVTALRDALTYEFVYTRHVVSSPLVRVAAEGDLAARSSFSIYQSTEQGVTRRFAVGGYDDLITCTPGGMRFKRRDVILDSFGVLNNLAVPL